MDWWVYATNIVVGGATWALTRFGIPFVNRELHADIPDGPTTEAELTALFTKVLEPAIESHIKRFHSTVAPHVHSPVPAPPSAAHLMITDLGNNPFTSAPRPADTDQATSPENGAT